MKKSINDIFHRKRSKSQGGEADEDSLSFLTKSLKDTAIKNMSNFDPIDPPYSRYGSFKTSTRAVSESDSSSEELWGSLGAISKHKKIRVLGNLGIQLGHW